MGSIICPSCGARDQVREEPATGAVCCEQCQHRFFVPEVVPKPESIVVQVLPSPPRYPGPPERYSEAEFSPSTLTQRRSAWLKTGLIIGAVVLAVGGL